MDHQDMLLRPSIVSDTRRMVEWQQNPRGRWSHRERVTAEARRSFFARVGESQQRAWSDGESMSRWGFATKRLLRPAAGACSS